MIVGLSVWECTFFHISTQRQKIAAKVIFIENFKLGLYILKIYYHILIFKIEKIFGLNGGPNRYTRVACVLVL